MKSYSRQQVIERLKRTRDSGRLILATGAGTGISAKFEEAGGSDLILVFNSGRFRMDGLGSLAGLLAYGDANALALEMGERHILPVVRETPVICSINGTDPTRNLASFLAQASEAGFSGINNFPTVGLIDGKFRQALEQVGLGYDKEVALIELARARELFTMAYVFDDEQARKMAGVGCDAIIVHLGLTVGGSIGAFDSLDIRAAARVVEGISHALHSVNSPCFLLCHGGPIETPENLRELRELIPVDGFLGASSIERIPVEAAIQSATAAFASLRSEAKGRTN